MTAAGFRLNGASLAADPSGALWWPEMRTLIVADLHFGKGSAYAAEGGALLPPYDSHATLERLEALAGRYDPARWVSLGDGFHDRDAGARLDRDAATRLDRLARNCDWLWLRGNHDPEPPPGFGGRAFAEWRAGPLVFRHEPNPGPAPGEVAGHLHPRATVATGRRQVSGRVFVTDGRRLLLPAFGAYTGGLDVHDPAVRMLFARPPRVLLPGRERVHAFPWSRLAVPDRLRNGGGQAARPMRPVPGSPARYERRSGGSPGY